MSFFDFFLYHTIRDVQKERGKQKEKRRQFSTDRMQAAGTAVADFGQAVIELAGRAYHSDSGPRELTDGIVPAALFAAATICRVDGGMTAEQEKVMQIVIDHFPGMASMAGLKSAVDSSAPLAQFFPAGYLTESDCGSFWRALYRCCKKLPEPSAELQTALAPFNDFLVHFSFAGRTDTKAESACNALPAYAKQHLNDPENDAAPELDLFGDGEPEEHMATFQKIYLQVVSKSNAKVEMDGIDQLLPLFKAKTITDLVMMGDIPADDKTAEVECCFAQFGVKPGVEAKQFLHSISSQDEFGRGISQIMDMHGTEPPQFWQICRILCIKAGEDTQLMELTKAYYGFVISMAAQLHHKYPNGNYTREKANEYAMALLDALETILK